MKKKTTSISVLLIATSAKLSSGATHSLIGLTRNLIELGINVDVVLPKYGDCESEFRHFGITPYHVMYSAYPSWVSSLEKTYNGCERVKCLVKRVCNFFSHIRIVFLINNKKYDIVHINALTSSLGAMEANFFGVPLIWHAREFLEEDISATFSNKKQACKLLNSAFAVVAVSEAVAKKHSEYVESEKLRVIYNGVSTKFLEKHDRRFDCEQFIFLLVGRITAKKNQLLACKAAGILSSMGIVNYRIDIIGPTEDPAYKLLLTSYIEDHGLSSCIRLLGQTNDIKSHYSEANALLLCAGSEAFGRTTVEAMLSECVVIGSNSGGTCELIKDGINGLLFHQGSAQKLAECMRYAIDHPDEMETLAKRAREIAFNRYTETKNAEAILALYQEALRSER